MATPPMDIPQPGYPRPRWGFGIVVGLVAGLVLGGGAVGLAWALSSGGPDGVAADVAAACGIVERTKDPRSFEDITLAEANRWAAAAALAESIGETGGQYRSLVDELTKAGQAVRNLNIAELRKASARVRGECADLT